MTSDSIKLKSKLTSSKKKKILTLLRGYLWKIHNQQLGDTHLFSLMRRKKNVLLLSGNENFVVKNTRLFFNLRDNSCSMKL